MIGSSALISTQRITELHAIGAEMGPIAGATQKPGCVEGAIGAAVQGAFYVQNTGSEQPDPLLVAAFLLRSLVQDHCFVDGNKRVAWLAVLDVLAVGANLTLRTDEEEAANFVLRVADGTTRSVPEIVAWLQDRLIAWSDEGPDQQEHRA
jgi:death on curing protein